MESGEAIHESLADAPGIIRLRKDRSGDPVSEDDAAPALHHKKHGTQYRRIFAHQIRLGRLREMRRYRFQHATFARHVVRLRSHRAEGSAPQYILLAARAYAIREVQMSTGELLDFDAARHA